MSNTSKAEQARAAATLGHAPCWVFAGARFEERSLLLTVDGRPTPLEPKPMEVLRHLLRHAGEVVTHEELEQAVWPGRFLSDTVLKKCISRLREALRDDDEGIIKTVRGYGYRLVAAVTVEQPAAGIEPAPRFELAPGDPIPQRPHWKLLRCLGGGGHGEAWLVQHGKTAAQQVFKFAQGEQALAGLKREITIYRLLHDTLGARTDFVQILDWNLEEAPYFIESEYVEGGNLADWAAQQGGLRGIALDTRLALAAEIAEALAAAHSVGVLHKDLKPANVLVCASVENASAPAIKLVDFGSGGVLDPARLDALGITRLGFTRAVGEMSSSGTPAYLAPEILAGQPATVRADVYALGVLLFQLVAGDFKKPLAPGWELDIDDALLREDIAEAAQGDPARRLGDAAALALRLRSLPQRRQQRAEEQASRDSAERTAKALERFRARRTGLLVAIGVLVLGLAATLTLYLKLLGVQQQREAALVQSEQVTDYLVSLFKAASPEKTGGKPIEPRLLIDEGQKQLETRLKDQPQVRARMLGILGQLYNHLGANDEAIKNLSQAVALQQQPGGDPLRLSETWNDLGAVQYMVGDGAAARHSFEQALSLRQGRVPEGDPKTLTSLISLGLLQTETGETAAGIARLEQAERLAAASGDKESQSEALTYLGSAYADQQRLDEALKAVDQGLALKRALNGEHDPGYLNTLSYKSAVVIARGDYETAERIDRQLLAEYERLYVPESDWVSILRYGLSRTLLARGKLDEALALQQTMIASDRKNPLGNTPSFATGLNELGHSLLLHGETKPALAVLKEAQAIWAASPERDRRLAHLNRLYLGAAELQAGDLAAARRLLTPPLPDTETGQLADRERARRLVLLAALALAEHRFAEAGPLLDQAALLKPADPPLQADAARLRLLVEWQAGNAAAALVGMEALLKQWNTQFDPLAPWALQLRLDYAAALLALNRRAEALAEVQWLTPAIARAQAVQSPERQQLGVLRHQLALN